MIPLDTDLLASQFRVFLLVFTRMTCLAAAAPVIGSALISLAPQLLAGLGTALSLIIMMNLPPNLTAPPFGWEFFLRVCGEGVLGLSLGFLGVLILAGIQVGGEVMDHLIGFAMVDVIDPISNESATLIGNLKGMLATVLFLLLHGHHHLFQGIMKSFEAIPPGGVGLPTQIWPYLEGYAEAVFVVGLQVATPTLLVMTVLWVPEGFLARMVPQLNLLVNDVPMRIGVGLFLVWLGMGPFVNLVANLVESLALASDGLVLRIAGS